MVRIEVSPVGNVMVALIIASCGLLFLAKVDFTTPLASTDATFLSNDSYFTLSNRGLNPSMVSNAVSFAALESGADNVADGAEG